MNTAATQERRARYRHGLWAEYVALLYLSLKGYRLVCWRKKTPVGEIDLILRRRRQLIFVEVKARRDHATAAHAVHPKNQARVVRAAQYFLSSHPKYAAHDIRFDAVLIAWYRWPHHIIHAFS